jgi:hypothetical protein
LQEIGIAWIAAHSPQGKGRVEHSFGTAQDWLIITLIAQDFLKLTVA